jgi:hypothetical protein
MIVPAWLYGLVLILQVPSPHVAAASVELDRERQAIRESETRSLDALAVRLAGENRGAASKEVRECIEPAPSVELGTRFIPLPEVVPASTNGLANVPARVGAAESWRDELRTIREAAAQRLLSLATRAAAKSCFALADDCLRTVVLRQPDHREARRLLGYEPHEGGWATPFAIRKLREGWVLHPKFGWVEAASVPHLDNSELPAPSVRGQTKVRWVPAAEADELHGTWNSRWKFYTEHFNIETDVPFAEAIAFGKQLEAFHDLFFVIFADLLTTDNALPLARRFRAKKPGTEPVPKPHTVYYFKNKDEYVDHLTRIKGPGIERSLGFYDPPKGGAKRAPAYFYREPDGQIAATATLYHEVSHQLLFETAGPNRYNKNVGNYWVFEGLGTYFETVIDDPCGPEGALLVGGLVGPRLESAQVRLLEEHEFIPIERMVRFNEREFTREEVIHLHYAESMALTLFLMQGRDGRYREPFLDYVKDAYRGRLRGDSGRSLEDRLGVPYSVLDAQFLAYLKPAPKPAPETRVPRSGK